MLNNILYISLSVAGNKGTGEGSFPQRVMAGANARDMLLLFLDEQV
jgi:hypothetical protein